MKHRDRASQHSGHERWLVSYADFVTLLFAFFVVLFASAQRNNASVREVAEAVRNGFRPDSGAAAMKLPHEAGAQSQGTELYELHRQLNEALGHEIATRQVSVQGTPEGLVISLQELGFFQSGQAALLPAARPTLRRIAATLTPHSFHLRVEGHSDNVPIHNAEFTSNWELSTARATAVTRILLDDVRFAPYRIAIAGYGEYHPVAPNDTPDGRRTNRRVDIVVLGQ